MKVKELIHKLTHEWVDQEAEVTVVSIGDGHYGVIGEVLTDHPWTKQRVVINAETRSDEEMLKIWGKS